MHGQMDLHAVIYTNCAYSHEAIHPSVYSCVYPSMYPFICSFNQLYTIEAAKCVTNETKWFTLFGCQHKKAVD